MPYHKLILDSRDIDQVFKRCHSNQAERNGIEWKNESTDKRTPTPIFDTRFRF